MNLEVLDGPSAFKVRAAALIVRDGRLLLNRCSGVDAWMLPGGTGEHGETVEQTLCRELSEELGADCRVGRLLWTVEHFFDLGVRRWHQLLWIYDVSVPDDSAVARADTLDTTGPGGSDHFRWFAKNDLTALRVLPGFVPSALGALPSEPRFLVHRDDLR